MQRSHDLQPQKIRAARVAAVPFAMGLFREQRRSVLNNDSDVLPALRIVDGAGCRPARLGDLAQRRSVRPTAGMMDDDFKQSRVMLPCVVQIGK